MAAVLGVASELLRKGYVVGLVGWATPQLDLLCSVPNGQTFKVQVKGCSDKNALNLGEKFLGVPAQLDLFLVVVLVPPSDSNASLRFFLLSQLEALEEWKKLPNEKADGSTYDPAWYYSLYWKCIEPYEGKWEKLPR